MAKACLAVRHVAFEDLGLLGPLLSARGYDIRYHDAGIDRFDNDTLIAPDLVVVLGGPTVGLSAAGCVLQGSDRVLDLAEDLLFFRRAPQRKGPIFMTDARQQAFGLAGADVGLSLRPKNIGARMKRMEDCAVVDRPGIVHGRSHRPGRAARRVPPQRPGACHHLEYQHFGGRRGCRASSPSIPRKICTTWSSRCGGRGLG